MRKQLLFTIIIFLNSLLIYSQIQKGQDLIGEGEFFQIGSTTAISSDGNRIVLGTTRYAADGGRFYGEVIVYDYNGSDWVQVGNKIRGTHNFNGFGDRVSISADGNTIAFTAQNSLESPSRLSNKSDVFIYQLIDNNWLQKGQKLTENESGDLFGNAISLSDDGSTIAIGADKRSTSATGKPYVEVYRYNVDGTDQWIQIGETLEGEVHTAFGGSVSLSSDGNILAVGAPRSNITRVYLFDELSLSWNLIGQELLGEFTSSFFGTSVSLSDNGKVLAVGAHGNRGNGSFSGHVRIFDYSATNEWIQKGSDIDGENANDISGTSISLSSDGNTIAIGAYRNNDNGNESGHVRVYRFNNDWQQLLSDIDGDKAGDELGFSVSLSGDGNTVLVGARNHDSDVSNSGLARAFRLVDKLNTTEGFVNYQNNNSICDPSGSPLQNILVTVSSNGTSYSTNTNSFGYYSIIIENEGDYSVSVGELPNNLIVPNIQNKSFEGFGNIDLVSFCIEGTKKEDLSITILPLNEARPGFIAQHDIIYHNDGTSVVSGEITLEFNQDIQNEQLINPNYTKIEDNKMTWRFYNLQPSETRVIFADFTISPPPIVNGDNILTYTANISNANIDATPEDNNFILERLVVNSFDPNDKRVTQGTSIYIDETDEYLDYMVRFQNTGTASAINVVIEDTLDSNLEWDTFQMVSTSHPYKLKIVDRNKIEFIFESINLPDSTSDERGSNGYVAFKIRPKDGIKIGDIIKGKADIYFDFNLPIETNEVNTEIINRPISLSVTDNYLDNLFEIYPIPVTQNKLFISKPISLKIKKISFITINGKEIDIIPNDENEIVLNTSIINSNFFFLKITTSKGVVIKKIIK